MSTERQVEGERVKELKAILVSAGLLVAAGASWLSAATFGSDNAAASAYSGGWTNGTDGSTSGDGFGAWSFTSSGTAGYFIGNSTNLSGGSGADINTSSKAFGLFSNKNDNGFALANRSFNGSLQPGQTFTIDLAVNFRNGQKGINIYDSNNIQVINFNIGGDDYKVNNTSIGNGYSNNTRFTLAIVQQTTGGGVWQLARGGGVSDFDSGAFTGLASRFQIYTDKTDGGSPNDFFANNLAVTPEPASGVLLGLGAIAVMRRRR